MSVAEFHRSFSVGQAVGFLAQIKGTLQQEAIVLPREGDFYTRIRHVFAEIDGLGKLLCGEQGKENTAQNAIAFGTEYLGRVNGRYGKMFGLLVDMYRHGLAHTHLTKCVRFRGAKNRWATLGWVITDTESDRCHHLTVERRETWFFRLWLHVRQLVDDTLKAIDLYSADLQARGVRSRLFPRFKRGYLGTAAVFQEPLPSTGTPPRRGRRQKPLALNNYSAPGISWVKSEIATGNSWKE